jgi:hypothetical protein
MSQLTDRWFPLRHYDCQQNLWADMFDPEVMRIAAPCGRQSGKSELAKRAIVLRLLNDTGYAYNRYFYCAPTREQAKRIAWYDLLELIPPEWIKDINVSELTIRTHCRSELQIIGLDSPSRAEGQRNISGVIVDESSDVKAGVVEQNIYPMLAHQNAFLWRIGVPRLAGPGGLEYRQFYDRCLSGSAAKARGHTWTAEVVMPPEAIAEAKRNIDPKTYSQEYLATWESMGGLVYYQYSNLNIAKQTYQPERELIVSADYNVDPMCWVIAQLIDGKFCVIGEIYEHNSYTQSALDRLWSQYSTHRGGFVFYGDPSANSRNVNSDTTSTTIIKNDRRFDSYKLKQVKYKPVHPLRRDRYAAVNSALRSVDGHIKILIDPSCKELIKDLQKVFYKEGTSEADTSDKSVGHITDALGYAVEYLWPIKRISTPGTVIIH